MTRLEGLALTLLRVVVAFLFIQHSAQKLFGALGGHPVPFASMLGAAGVIELVGGVLIFLGLFTRAAAFILAGEMASAYFMVHAPRGFLWPVANGGEPAVVYCFLFLYLWTRGAGPISLDASMRHSEPGTRPALASS
jgi:putative oxidoreductase